MATCEGCIGSAPTTMAQQYLGIGVSNSSPNLGAKLENISVAKAQSGSRIVVNKDPRQISGTSSTSRPVSRSSRHGTTRSRCASAATKASGDFGVSYPEKELFSKFRHVYAGKGGWFKGSSTPTGPGGGAPPWSPAGQRYKQEILKNLARTFSKKDVVSTQPKSDKISNTCVNSKTRVEIIQQNHQKHSPITPSLSKNIPQLTVTVTPPRRESVILEHTDSKQIPPSSVENKEIGELTHKTATVGSGVKSLDDCSSKDWELQKGGGVYGFEDGKRCLTAGESSINSATDRSFGRPQKAGAIDSEDHRDNPSLVAGTTEPVWSGRLSESTDSRKSLKQDTSYQESTKRTEHGQFKPVKHTTTDNNNTSTIIALNVYDNVKKTLEKVSDNKDSVFSDISVTDLTTHEEPSCIRPIVRANLLNVDTGISDTRRTKSGDAFRRRTLAVPSRQGGARSADDRDNRMTLFAQLSAEAQRALDETREEMVSCDRTQSIHTDEKDNDITINTDDNNPLGDHLKEVNTLLVQQEDILECSSIGSSAEPSDSVRDMDLDNCQFPTSSREREHYKSHELSRVHSRGNHKIPKARGMKNTGAPDFSPRAKAKPQRLKATHGLGESPIRQSQHAYPRQESLNRNGRLPQITSIDTSKLPRESELPWNSSHDFRIPNVGQYKQPALAQRLLTREQSFQITPFGYDSRIADMPVVVPEVEDDTPNEVKAQAIEKCSEWMKKYM